MGSEFDDRFVASFDIGGTFTDFVLLDRRSGEVHIHKALTTPSDPAIQALNGLETLVAKAGITLAELDAIIHGTTLVTNLVIERKGAPTALLTTKGFRDIIEIGTEQRYDIHDIFLQFPAPFVPRSRCFEITERMSHDGDVIEALDLDEVEDIATRAVAQGVEAIAIVFLHAYRNPDHERRVADLIRKRFPQIYTSISSEVCGEIREYERTVTTVANAYAQPIIDPYINRLEKELARRGFAGRLYLMQSSGDLASPAMMKKYPIRLLESGPAGGVLAAAYFGKTRGDDDVIAFDMGGTTAKVCLIQDGKADLATKLEAAREHRFKKGSGLPIKTPVVDLIEIGAGGGSIAHMDNIGLLKVGPESAGAEPGPACYGRGGTLPTVTDANLILGYLSPDNFLGGRLKLDVGEARRAYESLTRQIGGSVEEAAWGVYSIVCESMAGAARVHVVEKGCDPRRFSMIAFGGAGPAHAARIAKSIGVSTVIIPPASGAASALGCLSGRVAHEAARSAPGLLSDLDWNEANRILEELEKEGRALLETADIVQTDITVKREVDLRLNGQLHTIKVPAPFGKLSEKSIETFWNSFESSYRNLFGSPPQDQDLEAISWRVTCQGKKPGTLVAKLATASGAPREIGERLAWFPETGGAVATKIYSRYNLPTGVTISGPAIVEENESTTVVPPGDDLTVDDKGNLVINVASAAIKVFGTGAGNVALTLEAINSDPVGFEIMWSRLVNITEECWHTVIRTAYSLIIGEAQDFACEILDVEGNSLAHSPRAMPVFNISLMSAVKSLLDFYPPETLKPGDVLVTNDPWLCAGHLFDIAVVSPVFSNGKVVAFIGTVGHVSDIGGIKDRANAREIFDEGLQIPAMKLYSAGVPNDDLFRIIGQNVRNGRQVLGDIRALVTANDVGIDRLQSFMTEYGLTDLVALSQALQDRAELAVRAEIRKVPDGVYEGETTFNGQGEALKIPVRITVSGDSIAVDYDGCPPQMLRGGINCTMTVTEAETLFALKCIFSPSIRATAGCYRPFTVSAPEGSLLNCTRPASVNLRRLTMWQFIGMIFRTMSKVLPDHTQAYTALPSLIDLYGVTPNGSIRSEHIFVGGGQGAAIRYDGKSGLIWPTSAANTSIEMVESRLPILVTEKALIPDSGGAGAHRGGLGQILKIRALRDSNHRLTINVYPEGDGITAVGLYGGTSGGGTRAFISNGAGNGQRRELEAPEMLELKSVKDVVEVQVGGGAGFGCPRERERDRVRRDLAEGYITSDKEYV